LDERGSVSRYVVSEDMQQKYKELIDNCFKMAVEYIDAYKQYIDTAIDDSSVLPEGSRTSVARNYKCKYASDLVQVIFAKHSDYNNGYHERYQMNNYDERYHDFKYMRS